MYRFGTSSLSNSVMNIQLRLPIMCMQSNYTLFLSLRIVLLYILVTGKPSLMWCCNLLGTLLIALRGRSTLTVLMAVKLIFCRSSEYSTILENTHKTYRKTY